MKQKAARQKLGDSRVDFSRINPFVSSACVAVFQALRSVVCERHASGAELAPIQEEYPPEKRRQVDSS